MEACLVCFRCWICTLSVGARPHDVLVSSGPVHGVLVSGGLVRAQLATQLCTKRWGSLFRSAGRACIGPDSGTVRQEGERGATGTCGAAHDASWLP